MKFCSNCAAAVALKIPDGDNRPRYCCASCGTIHYQNPRLVLGTIPVFGEQILLCRRAIEPRHGYWTLPAGFMENGETLEEGASRETTEEAGIDFQLGNVFSMLSVQHVDQVHVFFLATMTSARIGGGPETLEARLFDEDEIPWDNMAFHTVTKTLRWFFDDRRSGSYGVHSAPIVWSGKTRR